MGYKTSDDLDQAIKAAAKASPMDTGRAYVGFFFHRLLCRVFSDPDSRFLLKGGLSMLARTIDARTTRDIDLLSTGDDLEEAVEELKRLAATDLGDFVTFSFAGMAPIKAEDEYRSGMNVRFQVRLGNKRLQDISIDLVVDDIPQEDFDTVMPADRITVRDLPTCSYRVYAVESSLADKFCGIVERHHDRPSSRQKDLVGVVVFARSCAIDGTKLSRRLRLECLARRMPLPNHFEIPAEWFGAGKTRFRKLCRQVPLASDIGDISDVAALAAALFDPALEGSVEGKIWNPALGSWG